MEPTFVEEIDFQELQFYEVVGKGAFGVVSRAKWRSKDVAVKLIETESERKAFMTELKQLSRVNHPNIVKLYGACTKPPTVCLVMEYAEGGSLYNVLHGAGPQPIYNTAHAMSWLLQCSKGVEYLHGMKPKALIHRDLKPPNLLLIMGGTVLKICDFGTACDIQTHMTNNKGSAAWMAPEVFEGNMYSEKCDVFSFGIILWEVITRRKPFDEIGGPAFRIMWAVHNGTRPPLISNLPKPLELLMVRCWSGNPAERPSMIEVARIMTHLYQFFRGAEEPLVYPNNPQSCESPDFTFNSVPVTTSYSNTPPSSNTSTTSQHTGESRSGTLIGSDTIKKSDEFSIPPPLPPRANPPVNPPVLEDEQTRGQQSAPPSLAGSRDSLNDATRSGTPDHLKRYSADSTLMKCDIREITNSSSGSSGNSYKGRGHRRVGSDEGYQIKSTSPVFINTAHIPVSSGQTFHQVSTFPGSITGNRANALPQRSVSHQPQTSERVPATGSRHASWTSDSGGGIQIELIPPRNTQPSDIQQGTGLSNAEAFAMNLVYHSLDQQLQPITPYPPSQESMEIYQQHCELAQEYLKVQTELALLIQRKNDLLKEFEIDEQNHQSSTRLYDEYNQLIEENESLKLLRQNLSKQVQQIRQIQQRRR
ncbi:mitogen-activated protein kinase kinase kinase 7-like isoform X4 [Mytilus californianus]|uniref:mitogen-activated protein kinase kinase kinase 7-like isoform X4 n=1 Tax=Mytilus californianus TaxID=6549 RepID=UPI00224595F9|nr:mitogen-activated protein kinase kinase kinase 7-like isoform X4 [Mytilus californianus]